METLFTLAVKSTTAGTYLTLTVGWGPPSEEWVDVSRLIPSEITLA